MRYKRFKGGREFVESDPRSGKSSTSRILENVERVKTAINEIRLLAVLELEHDLGIPRTIVSGTLTEDPSMTHVAAKFVPRLLTREQKEFHAEIHRTYSNCYK